MLAKQLAVANAPIQGELDAGTLHPEESLESVLDFICRCLKTLAEGRTKKPLPDNESGLTQRLLTELERASGHRPYFFQKEFMEDEGRGNSERSDISVQIRDGDPIVVDGVRFADGARFLALEAKRLPLPKKSREREYLVGQHGAVERFKRSLHGRGLKTVAVLAYIQSQGFEKWRDRINVWVEELIAASTPELPWDASDKLEQETRTPPLTRFLSNNLRVGDNVRLKMHHIWVQLGDDAAACGPEKSIRSAGGRARSP